MDVVPAWTGHLAISLQRAMRMTNEAFAGYLGLATRTVAKWHELPNAEPVAATQEILDAALANADVAVQKRFAALAGIDGNVAGGGEHVVSSSRLAPWALADALTRSSLSAETVDEIEWAVSDYSVAYPVSPPDALIVPVTEQISRIARAIPLPQRLRVQQRLVALIGSLAGVAGNLYIDLGRQQDSIRMFRVGRIAATEVDNRDLAAWLSATESISPFFADNWVASIDLLDQANVLAEAGSSPRRRSWIAAMSARASAAAGQEDAARQALEKAYSLIGGITEPPVGNDFFDEPRLAGMGGSAMLLLRDASRARELLADALITRSVHDLKGRALLTLDLASCHVIDGEIEEASRLAGSAIAAARGALVAPVVDRARRLRRDLQPWADTQPVLELDAQLRDVTARDSKE